MAAHSVEAAMALMDAYEFDTILFPFNYATWYAGDFGPQVMAKAKEKEMGILALKAMAWRPWEKDEEILIKYINCSKDDVKFILAPHEINSKKIYRLLEQIDLPVVRFTDEDKGGYARAKVLLIDTIGHLSSIYKYGDIAYIGGGFGKGIHNTLEAATYGLPVVFGPNYHKFREAIDMLECNAAFSVNTYSDLLKVFNNFIGNEETLRHSSSAAKNYVRSKLGATRKIVNETLIKTV